MNQQTVADIISNNLSGSEKASMLERPGLSRALFGTAYHRAVAEELRSIPEYRERFTYKVSHGTDFYDHKTVRMLS